MSGLKVPTTAALLARIAEDDALIEIGRKAVEDTLIDFRDERISIMGRGNGFVCREADGTDSHIIRLGTPEGIRIALRAMAKSSLEPSAPSK